MRVYLAANESLLRELVETGQSAGPWEGFAATSAIRRELGELADEDLEFALSEAAAEASAAAGGARRLVLVADVDDAAVTTDDDAPGAVRVAGSVALGTVDALLAGEAAQGVEGLSWYATQEISGLLVSH